MVISTSFLNINDQGSSYLPEDSNSNNFSIAIGVISLTTSILIFSSSSLRGRINLLSERASLKVSWWLKSAEEKQRFLESKQDNLIRACRDGELALVQFLVNDCGADVHEVDECGNTALMIACLSGKLEVVKYLVEECKADVNAQDLNGMTVLVEACLRGGADIVKCLVNDCGADVNAQDRGGQTALMIACLRGNLEEVKYLVEDCKADVNAKDQHGKTVLMWACEEGNLELVKYLVEDCKADVNAQDKDGKTALMRMIACEEQDEEEVAEMVRVLLAQPEATQTRGAA